MFGKQQFVGKMKGSLNDNYTIVKELGSGSYGRVYEVINKTSNEKRACKQLTKGRIKDIEKFTLEINIMIETDHPNIIKLYEVYEDNRYIYLIMECCSGGELFDRILDRINSKNLYTEKQACHIFKQMVSAICYCHSQKICHRDLKPENLLFLNSSEDSPLKVIDFGLSKIFTKDNHKMTTKVGTAYYVSPEVLAGDYDEKCDVWSAGVILYILLTGEPPFNGANDNEIYKRIQAKKYNFNGQAWEKISSDVKDLISKMLTDPKDRLTAEQVLNHNWIVNNAPNSNDCLLSLDFNNLKNYRNNNKLKKAVLVFIASRLNESDIKVLRDIFVSIDKNQDGSLTLEEIKLGVSKLSNSENINIEEIFKSIDTDGSGVINYTEFLAATIDQSIYLKQEKLYEAFKMFDKDGSGKISLDEIKVIMQNEDDVKVKELVSKYDLNGDGEIDYAEFLDMMSKLELS